MYWLAGIMTLSVLAVIGSGIYLEVRPAAGPARPRRWLKGGLAINLLLFAGAAIGLLMIGVGDVLAATGDPGTHPEISLGLGLALLGIGLPTAVATVAAALAVGPIGAASLAVIAERPEMFGRTLIYLGLAEGIAIYGLVVTILLLGKIG